jgi:hypothetical protein
MRPKRAKAPMEINLADSRCCWSRYILGGSNNNKNLSVGDWEIAFSLLYPIFHGKSHCTFRK